MWCKCQTVMFGYYIQEKRVLSQHVGIQKGSGVAVGKVVSWGLNSIFSGRFGAEQDCGMMYSRKRKYFIKVLEHKKKFTEVRIQSLGRG